MALARRQRPSRTQGVLVGVVWVRKGLGDGLGGWRGDVGRLLGWCRRRGNDAGARRGVEGGGDGEIMADMDDATGEGNALCVVLGGAGEHFGGEILELDGFGDSTGFVEAIHVVCWRRWR